MVPPTHPLGHLLDAASGRPAEDVLGEMAREIRAVDGCLIFAHLNPDGDALGSQAALALALRSLGIRGRAICAREYPEKFRAVFPQGLIEVRDDAGGLDPAELRILLDTGETMRAGPFEEFLKAAGGRRFCIDHHPHRDGGETPDPFDARLVVTASPATGNLVLGLLDALGAILTPEIAQALWIAIVTDTGWFRFHNTSSWALRDAARLLEVGVPTESLHRQIYEEFAPERARVLGTLLSGVRTALGGRLVWAALSLEAWQEERLGIADLDGFVDFVKSVRGAEVAAMIVEVERGRHKVSLRAPGEVDVETIARRFGGGGHPRAAGYRRQGSLDAVVGALEGAVRAALEGARCASRVPKGG